MHTPPGAAHSPLVTEVLSLTFISYILNGIYIGRQTDRQAYIYVEREREREREEQTGIVAPNLGLLTAHS